MPLLNKLCDKCHTVKPCKRKMVGLITIWSCNKCWKKYIDMLQKKAEERYDKSNAD